MPASQNGSDPHVGGADDQASASPARKAWWQTSQEYDRGLRAFGRADLWLALAVVALSFVALYLKGLHDAGRDYLGEAAQLRVGFAEVTIWLVLLGVVVALRRQEAQSFGFSRTRLGRSFTAGLIGAAIMVAATATLGLLLNGSLQQPEPYWFTWGIPYYLVVIGFQEELLWRGFVTPRLEAQFGRRWIGVLLAGVLFGLMHVPYQYAISGMSLGQFLAAGWVQLLIPVGWHFVLWWLYARWNSLAAPTLVHWAMNWSALLL